MGKHDQASFRLKVDGLRLSPATAADQERLATYRNGSELFATITQPKNDKLLRKYWAILGRAVRDCPTPWRDKEAASEAIKLALGAVHYGKTVTGKFMQWPRSLADMEAPDFERFYEDAIALLSRITGVDVETLKKESAEVGEDAPAAVVDESQAEQPEVQTTEDQADDQPRDLRLRNLMKECLEKFIGVVTDTKVPDRNDRQDNLIFAKNVWKDELPERPDFVKACLETCNQVLKGTASADQARADLAKWLP